MNQNGSNQLFSRLDTCMQLSDDERACIDVVSGLVREKIAPRAEEYDKLGEFPWANIEDLNALDLNCAFLPEKFGGLGFSYRSYLQIVQEISQGCGSTGIIWSTTAHACNPVIDFGTSEQLEQFLPRIADGGLAAIAITEDSGGSDVRAMRTTIEPVGSDVIIQGQKLYITNGDVADLCVVFGKWTEIADPKRSMTAVVVERGTPGFEVLRNEDKMGHRASSTSELGFSSCRVPAENVLGAPGDGFAILLSALNKSRPSVAAHAIGLATAAFDAAVEHVNTRQQFGQPLLKFQGVQFMVAEMASQLALAKAWLAYVAGLVDSGESNFATEASLLKVAATDAAMDIATKAVQLHGGSGYMRGSVVERLFRDAKLTQIWEGANEIHLGHIGRAFLEKPVVR